MPWLKSHHYGYRWWYVTCNNAKKNPVICILGKSFSNYHCQLWMTETHYTTPCSKLILRQEHTWHMFNPIALGLPFNTTYVSTYILQVFGVDILPSPMNTITDIIFKLHDRNYSVRFHNCPHWVADTPKNLHPNTLGSHFEIHFQWHINRSLVDFHNRNTRFGLHLVYKQLYQVNIESSLGTMLVAQS